MWRGAGGRGVDVAAQAPFRVGTTSDEDDDAADAEDDAEDDEEEDGDGGEGSGRRMACMVPQRTSTRTGAGHDRHDVGASDRLGQRLPGLGARPLTDTRWRATLGQRHVGAA